MTTQRLMFPRWLRFWHWANAIVFFVLLYTGFNLHFAALGAGNTNFRRSVVLHNAFGLALIALYVFYVVAQLVTGHIRQYKPTLRGVFAQTRWYLFGVFRGEHHPFESTVESRFNPIQRLAYVFAVYVLFPAQAITGIALLYPDRAPASVAGMGGIWPMAVGHSVVAYAFTAFLLVHLYLALTIAEENTGVVRMLAGDREPTAAKEPDEPAPHA